jgi:hypothetical protein
MQMQHRYGHGWSCKAGNCCALVRLQERLQGVGPAHLAAPFTKFMPSVLLQLALALLASLHAIGLEGSAVVNSPVKQQPTLQV